MNERDRTIVELHEQGMTLRAIGKQVGISGEAVRLILIKHGFKGAYAKRIDGREGAIKLAISDLTISVAEAVRRNPGATSEYVWAYLKAHHPSVYEIRKQPIWKRTGMSKCTTCKQTKDMSFFYMSKTKNQPISRCKSCSARHYQNRRDNIDLGMLREKKCAMCREIKPAAKFYTSKIIVGGLTSYCISCSNKANRDYKNKIKREREQYE